MASAACTPHTATSVYCARIIQPRRILCTGSVDDRVHRSCLLCTFDTATLPDRARTSISHRSPCISTSPCRARRFETHRTPCSYCADDRARRWMHHRTLCTANADDRGGRSRPLRTPCIASSSARARTPTLRRSPCTWTSAGRVCSIPSSSVSSPSERRRLRTSRRRPEGFRERRGSYSPSQAWYPTCKDKKCAFIPMK